MRQMKRFRDLSYRQKNRRLKQMQISENFVPDIINNLNKTANSFKKFNQKRNNSLKACLDQKMSNHIPQAFDNIYNNLSENIVNNIAIDQSNVTHVSTFSTSEREHLLFNKQISLREKLIL